MKLPSVHIYLHDTYQREKFLREQLLPYVEKKNINSFFLVDWENGPHIKWVIDDSLSMKETDSIINETIIHLKEIINNYRAKNTLNKKEFLNNVQHLEYFELKNASNLLEKDTTIKHSTTTLRKDIWGENGVHLIKRYYFNSNSLVSDIIKRPDKKYENVLLIMYAALIALGEPKIHQLSYRSHAEAFLGRFDQKDILRNQLEKQYKRNRNKIEYLFQEEIFNSTLYKDWKKLYMNLAIRASNLFSNKQLIVPEAEQFTKIIDDYNWSLNYNEEESKDNLSEFHKILNQIRPYENVQDDSNYKVKRLLLNYVYLTMVQLGVTGLEKFSMCYSIARWYEEKMDLNWKEQLVNKYNLNYSL